VRFQFRHIHDVVSFQRMPRKGNAPKKTTVFLPENQA
jgi:hypothetical protein